MSTFFGGQQFVSAITLNNEFTPADQQKIDLYTIPAGHFALLKMLTFASTDIFTDPAYYIYLRRNFDSNINYAPQNSVNGANYDCLLASARAIDYGMASQQQLLQMQIALSNRSSIPNEYIEQIFTNTGGEDVIMMQKDFYCNEGETLRFDSVTNQNSIVEYMIHLHLFKKP